MKPKGVDFTRIIDIRPNQNISKKQKINARFIILEIFKPCKLPSGSIVQTYLVSDESASIKLSLWDGKGAGLKPGDICLIENGYCGLHKSQQVLYCGNHGIIRRTGEFFLVFNESMNVSNFYWERGKDGQLVKARNRNSKNRPFAPH